MRFIQAQHYTITPQPDHTTRGHVEKRLGRKMVACLKCKAKKPPRGGWPQSCAGDARRFMGG